MIGVLNPDRSVTESTFDGEDPRLGYLEWMQSRRRGSMNRSNSRAKLFFSLALKGRHCFLSIRRIRSALAEVGHGIENTVIKGWSFVSLHLNPEISFCPTKSTGSVLKNTYLVNLTELNEKVRPGTS